MNLSTRQRSLTITLRPMREDDLGQVQAIDEISFSNPWPKNAYRFELLENINGYCWVAEARERLVGVIVCWLILDEMHIATIAVHPDFRGHGISKKMICTAFKALIQHGACSATLEVRAGNIVAQNLYHYFGFRQVGLRKNYYKDTGEDALLMSVFSLGQSYLDWLDSGAENPWMGSDHL